VYRALLYRLLLMTTLERIAFYGIRALVLIFAVRELGFSDTSAFQLTATLMAASFGFSVLGGWLADRFTGQQPIMLWGIFLNFLGCTLLLTDASFFFLIGVGLVFTGTSLFRPNIMVLIGQVADHLQLLKDSAYTLFYIIFNVGALIGIFGCAALGEHLGWQYAFAASLTANGLTLGLLCYNRKKFYQFQTQSFHPKECLQGLLISIMLLPIIMALVHFRAYVLTALPYLLLTFMIGFYIFARRMGAEGKQWYWGMTLLILINMIFFGLYEQQSNSLMLFTERHIDRAVPFAPGNIQFIPTTLFQAIDPFYNILLGSATGWLWYKLDQYHKNPSGFIKCVLGLMFMGMAFMTIVVFKSYAVAGAMTVISLFVATAFMVVGELLTLPTSMSICSRLAPSHLLSFSMGIWSLSMAFSEFLAVTFASLTGSIMRQCPNNPEESLSLYCDCFWIYGLTSIGCGAIILLILPILRRQNKIFAN
jgi:POT family proton-dependent oligopeptide transporter